MHKIGFSPLIEILGGNPNLNFCIKKELSLFIQESTFLKTHKNSRIFPLWKKTTSTQSMWCQLSKIKHFSLIEFKPSRPSFKSNSFKFIQGDWIRGFFKWYSKFKDCTHTNINTKFNSVALISCLIYIGLKLVFTLPFWSFKN